MTTKALSPPKNKPLTLNAIKIRDEIMTGGQGTLDEIRKRMYGNVYIGQAGVKHALKILLNAGLIRQLDKGVFALTEQDAP